MRFGTRVLGFGAALLSLVACQATVEDTQGGESDITAGGVCATLDYQHAVDNRRFYRQFASDEAAATYVSKVIANGMFKDISGPDATFKEITQDERLVRILGEAYSGFKKAFPKETAGLDKAPRIAILNSDVVNAFAAGTGFAEDGSASSDQSPWIFFVHTALLAIPFTDNELRGVFAHELGHLVLRTFLPEIRAHVRAIYLAPKSEDGILGAAQADDPNVAAHVEKMLKIQEHVGALPELGLPVATRFGYYGKLFDLLSTMAGNVSAESKIACDTAKEGMDTLVNGQAMFLTNQVLGDMVPVTPTPEQQQRLDAKSDAVADQLRACFAFLPAEARDGSILAMTAAVNKMDGAEDPSSPNHQKLLEKMLPAELEADEAGGSLIERLLRAQKTLRSEYMTLRDDPTFPVDDIRVFDYEEDADDAAARVLTAIGKSPTGEGEFLLRVVPEDARQKCLADIAAHRKIGFGRFIDTHPAICWRYYHATQFASALAQCTPGDDLSLSSSGPRLNRADRPSVLDVPADQAVEHGYGRSLR